MRLEVRPHLVLAAAGLLASPSAAQDPFVERALEVGLVHECLTGRDRLGEGAIQDWIQQGVALGDLNGDQALDVVACGGLLENHVFLNAGPSFTDATDAAGINVGAFDRAPALADYDLDGDLDLFLGTVDAGAGAIPGTSRLYKNDGLARFEDVTFVSGTVGAGHSAYPKWGDLDRDGLPDLYVGEFHVTRNLWYRNNGNGSFTERAADLGLDALGSCHAVGIADTDEDGLDDVFIANDWLATDLTGLPDNAGDIVLSGQASGDFQDVSAGSAYDHERGIMGITFGDVDYDGDLDVYKTDIGYNPLMLNEGWPGSGLPWVEAQFQYKVDCTFLPFPGAPPGAGGMGPASGWAAVFLDVDFDLWLDLFVVNGHVAGINPDFTWMPRGQRNYLYVGEGEMGGFEFRDRTEEYGLLDHVDDRGAAVGDLDSDGDLDILVMPTVGRLRYFENNVDPAGQGWFTVEATCQSSVPGGFGVRAEWTDSLGYPHVRVIGADGPTASQNELAAYFGMGTEPSADLTVSFPSGIQLAFPGVTPGTQVQAVEPELVRLSRRTFATFGGALPPVLTVTVFAHGVNGTPLDGTAPVTLDVPGLSPLTPLVHVAGNEFRRRFQATGAPGSYPVQVTMGGWQPAIVPQVHLYGPADPSTTRVVVVPAAVRARTADRFTVHVSPRDPGGVALGAGHAVDVSIPRLTPLGPVVDHGDGHYSVDYGAPADPGTYRVSVTVDGSGFPNAAAVEVGGDADWSQTAVVLDVPYAHHAASPNQIKLQLTPRDAAGRRLGPGAEVSVAVAGLTTPAIPANVAASPPSSSAGAQGGGGPAAAPVGRNPLGGPGGSGGSGSAGPAGSGSPSPHALKVLTVAASSGQRDGDFVFVLEKPLEQPEWLPEGVLAVTVDGVQLGSIPFAY